MSKEKVLNDLAETYLSKAWLTPESRKAHILEIAPDLPPEEVDNLVQETKEVDNKLRQAFEAWRAKELESIDSDFKDYSQSHRDFLKEALSKPHVFFDDGGNPVTDERLGTGTIADTKRQLLRKWRDKAKVRKQTSDLAEKKAKGEDSPWRYLFPNAYNEKGLLSAVVGVADALDFIPNIAIAGKRAISGEAGFEESMKAPYETRTTGEKVFQTLMPGTEAITGTAKLGASALGETMRMTGAGKVARAGEQAIDATKEAIGNVIPLYKKGDALMQSRLTPEITSKVDAMEKATGFGEKVLAKGTKYAVENAPAEAVVTGSRATRELSAQDENTTPTETMSKIAGDVVGGVAGLGAGSLFHGLFTKTPVRAQKEKTAKLMQEGNIRLGWSEDEVKKMAERYLDDKLPMSMNQVAEGMESTIAKYTALKDDIGKAVSIFARDLTDNPRGTPTPDLFRQVKSKTRAMLNNKLMGGRSDMTAKDLEELQMATDELIDEVYDTWVKASNLKMEAGVLEQGKNLQDALGDLRAVKEGQAKGLMPIGDENAQLDLAGMAERDAKMGALSTQPSGVALHGTKGILQGKAGFAKQARGMGVKPEPKNEVASSVLDNIRQVLRDEVEKTAGKEGGELTKYTDELYSAIYNHPITKMIIKGKAQPEAIKQELSQAASESLQVETVSAKLLELRNTHKDIEVLVDNIVKAGGDADKARLILGEASTAIDDAMQFASRVRELQKELEQHYSDATAIKLIKQLTSSANFKSNFTANVVKDLLKLVVDPRQKTLLLAKIPIQVTKRLGIVAPRAGAKYVGEGGLTEDSKVEGDVGKVNPPTILQKAHPKHKEDTTFNVKEGVNIKNVIPPVKEAIDKVAKLAKARFGEKYAATITSGNDSKKHKPDSKHYRDRAFDLRTNDLFKNSGGRAKALENYRKEIEKNLGDGFKVMLESVGQSDEHIHIQHNKE